MKSSHKLKVVALLFGAYLWAPVLAGRFAVGDCSGPRIYPVQLHATLYHIGWDLTAHDDGKPRIGLWGDMRPWFYGLKSGNRGGAHPRVRPWRPDLPASPFAADPK